MKHRPPHINTKILEVYIFIRATQSDSISLTFKKKKIKKKIKIKKNREEVLAFIFNRIFANVKQGEK